MKNYLNLNSKRVLLGGILALSALIFIVYTTAQIKVGIVLSTLFIFSGCFNVVSGALGENATKRIYIVWYISSSFIACYLCQVVLSANFISLGILKVLLGMLICMVMFLVLSTLTLKPMLSISSITSLLVLFASLNYFVYEFRGSEINPSDMLSIQTAMNVIAKYKMILPRPICYGFTLTVAFIFLSFGLPRIKNMKNNSRLISFALVLVLIAIYLPLSANVEPIKYKMYGSLDNGFVLNFFLQLKDIFVTKPEGYSSEIIDYQAQQYLSYSEIADPVANKPDIIVIMDESFADLSKLGSELKTNQRITPFIDSLSENTIRGYALSSVFGGGTPNSEYEFLSGNSMLFLPTDSIVYQQYIKHPCYSMVEELKSNGYKCISMHPYLSNGWARTTVYPKMGFDESYFLDAFSDELAIRNYISDLGMFKRLVDIYEKEKESEHNVFMFGVTMQNHGGYFYEGDNFEQSIYLEGYSQDYNDAEQYLSLIHETDKAIEYLMHYFEKLSKEVVIVFYGDHLPKVDNGFYEEVHGGDFESLDERQLEYTVPFFIWTNYDIEEKMIDLTSLNFLSNYVYQTAGLPLPEYNKFLSTVQNVIPAMNSNGYYSRSQHCFVEYDNASGDEADVLNLYNQLQYNNMFDSKNRNEILFPLSNGK